jgi:hypothetical protein
MCAARKAGRRAPIGPPTALNRQIQAARLPIAPTIRRPHRRPTILLRWRFLTSIEAAMPALPDLNAPEFAPIKARFARTYLEHKADLGVPNASDEAVLAHVDDITAILFASSVRAWRTDDQR